MPHRRDDSIKFRSVAFVCAVFSHSVCAVSNWLFQEQQTKRNSLAPTKTLSKKVPVPIANQNYESACPRLKTGKKKEPVPKKRGSQMTAPGFGNFNEDT